jgi:hypothetical protein
MSATLSPEVVELLVERHRRFLHLLESPVGSRAMAEERLQAAFVKAVERGNELREDESAVARSIGCCATRSWMFIDDETPSVPRAQVVRAHASRLGICDHEVVSLRSPPK